MSPRLIRNLWQYGLFGAIVLVLGVFLLYPIALTVRGGFYDDVAGASGWSLRHLAMVFENPVYVEGLVNAFVIAIGTTVLSVVIALPLAVLSARYTFPGKTLFSSAILVPLILPPFVGAIGMKALLGRAGAINALLGTEWDILGQAQLIGVIIIQALHLYPIIYLNATAALANLDPALEEAAENLGATWWDRFVGIVLPLVRPGLFAGATIVFIWAFTEVGTPLMLDVHRVTPVQIFNGIKEVESSADPYALTVVMLASAVMLYVLGKAVFGGKAYAMYSKASRAGGERPLPAWIGLPAATLFGLVTFAALLPHLGVVFTSLSVPGQWYNSVLPTSWTGDHFEQALTADLAARSIRNSLGLSFGAMLLNTGVGVLVAYLIVRTTVKGRSFLDALCMMPLAVPGLVMAFGYVAMSQQWPMGKDGPLGDLVLGEHPNPIPLLVIAYAVRRLPYIVRASVAGMEQTSGELEEAAVNLGATRVRAVIDVIVPLIMANLIAGGLLVFSFSMLEVSDSLILAQSAEHYPITKAIYSFSNRLGDGPYVASAMGVWGMGLLAVTLVGASVLMGKKLGSIFRV